MIPFPTGYTIRFVNAFEAIRGGIRLGAPHETREAAIAHAIGPRRLAYRLRVTLKAPPAS